MDTRLVSNESVVHAQPRAAQCLVAQFSRGLALVVFDPHVPAV